MNKQRLDSILGHLAEQGITQMIITDPYTIFYLTGRYQDPGERLFALYINQNGQNRIFINELFTVPEDLGVEKVWFCDTDDYLHLLGKYTDPTAPLGVDKTMHARFLLPLIDGKCATAFINTSICADEARAVKDAEEIELMRHSSRINDAAMGEIVKLLTTGITEREVAGAVAGIYRKLGGEGFSFDPLVEFGPNCAIGHHTPDDTPLKEGDSIIIDIGCRYHGYCSDMTRSFFYKKILKENDRFVYDTVKQANESAEALIRPGIQLCELDKTARDIITKAGYGKEFTHRLGHFIGIEDHDYGDVSLANTALTRPGNVFSIEPGIYIPNDMGIRIEDLALVTENGAEILNKYPKELTILE
ncbi:MAG: Xaa-Pro peptidase family protein [Clostridiales bacterium]|nr:Xaa-Pro peptidase family protein [Clostridiales bacterium]